MGARRSRGDRRVYRTRPHDPRPAGAPPGSGRRVRLPEPATSGRPGPRSVGLLAGAVLALGLAGEQLARLSLDGGQVVLRSGGLADPAATEALVAAVAAGAATVVCGWLLIGVLLTCIEVLAAPAGPTGLAAGRWARRWARRLAPAVLRHGVAALLGVTLGVGTLTAALPASAATGPVRSISTGAAITAADGLSPGWSQTRTAVPAAPSTTPAPAPVLSETGPGWLPTRPQARHAQTPQAQTPTPTDSTDSAKQADRAAALGLASSQARRPRARAELGDEVVIRRGDTLWALAARQLGRDASDAQIALEWPTWFEANRAVIGDDPDVLRPGVRLRVPEQGGAR